MTHPSRLRVKSQIAIARTWKSTSSRALKPYIIALASLLLAGCGTTSNQPIIVHLNESEEQGSRFRTQERQRDVWIAPQATDETLIHEQVVTFVEKPQGWKLPTTIEPNTVSHPDLPLEQGDYDGEVLRRQKEMIQDQENQIVQTKTEIEKLKIQSQQTVDGKNQQIVDVKKKLQDAQLQLDSALQKLKETEEATQKKQEKKSWWKIW